MALRGFTLLGWLAVAAIGAGLGGCGTFPAGGPTASLNEKECLTRAMYFESNRGSQEGMMAVGTVVMNRVENPRYPKSICGVVGQRNQFAEGVMTKPMTSRALPKVEQVADALLAGERHEGVGRAMFFHTAGYRFPYRNMHYMVVAGGNAFYDKRPNPTQTQNHVMTAALSRSEDERRITLAAVETAPKPARPPREKAIVVAAREPAPAVATRREKGIVVASLASAPKAAPLRAEPFKAEAVAAAIRNAPAKTPASKPAVAAKTGAPVPPSRSIAELLGRHDDKPGKTTKLSSLALRGTTR